MFKLCNSKQILLVPSEKFWYHIYKMRIPLYPYIFFSKTYPVHCMVFIGERAYGDIGVWHHIISVNELYSFNINISPLINKTPFCFAHSLFHNKE